MRLEWSATSGEPPERVVDGSGGWREREGAVRANPTQSRQKNKRWRYLRARRTTTGLREVTASRTALGNGGFAGSGEMLDARRGKGRRWGLGWSFIGGRCAEKRKESGADWPLAKRARWLAMRGCANGGRRLGRKVSPPGKKGNKQGRKGRGRRREWGWLTGD